MSYTQFKFTVTGPPTLFPDGFTEEHGSLLARELSKMFEKLIISTEHGGITGHLHYEGICESVKEIRTFNVRRAMYRALGFKSNVFTSWDPAIKKRFIVVKPITYLPGAIAYVMKENTGDVIRQGYELTWLQEQIVEAKKNHALAKCGSEIWINDSNHYKMCLQYATDHNMDLKDLKAIMLAMHCDNYDFGRVRNLKYCIAKWDSRQANDHTQFNCWFDQSDMSLFIVR